LNELVKWAPSIGAKEDVNTHVQMVNRFS
jgi:hypothetical protein